MVCNLSNDLASALVTYLLHPRRASGPPAARPRGAPPHDPVSAEQIYWVSPWADEFTLDTAGQIDVHSAQGQLDASELEFVLVDASFTAEHFTKTYPNFVGIVRNAQQPHFGWRRGYWWPKVVSFLGPSAFDESISLLRRQPDFSLGRVRQGFWPAQRPRPGMPKTARAEYLAHVALGTPKMSGHLDLTVKLHRGHHQQARRRLEELSSAKAPLVVTPRLFAWGRRLQPVEVSFSKNWFSPYWGIRMAVPLPKRKGRVTVAVKPLTEKMGGRPRWFRCVQANGEADLAEREFEVSEDGETLLVDIDPRWGETLHVYASREELPSPLRLPTRPAGIRAETFEKPAAGWQLGRQRQDGVGRVGSKGVRLVVAEGGAPSVIANGSLTVQPGAAYRLTFWARSTTPGAELRANFFSGPKHDFQQETIPIQADGTWRQYGATVRTGKFPPSVRPAFRLWALGRPQTIDVDDLSLKPLKAPPETAVLPAGKVERLW